jgi:hypothetical protein
VYNIIESSTVIVFSADTLPQNPRLLVCNTDPSEKPGRHCICISVNNGRGEYFDSFGRAPNELFERYMNSLCSSWIFNDRQLQSAVSKFCGHYCIYYCLLRSRGIDLRKIVRSFSSDTGFNDALVHRFVCGNV